ncbi:MAG TPA: ribosome maturation factor RimM [Streptosporangiaceae bacterium]|nr:ribosome maturation factor RimM [Streptosporangiaceae bacterium]
MLLVVGRIGRPHGVRGEVAVDVRTDDPGQRFASGCVLATQPEALGPLTVVAARPHAGGLIVSFAGISDRDEAQQVRGTWLVIDSADVPAPDDPDEYNDYQLIGLDVVTVAGRHVGTVADVRHHGQDLLVVRTASGAAEILVPFVAAIVPEVDVRAGRLLIDPPMGLLEQNEPA